jgi:hypothetical protein
MELDTDNPVVSGLIAICSCVGVYYGSTFGWSAGGIGGAVLGAFVGFVLGIVLAALCTVILIATPIVLGLFVFCAAIGGVALIVWNFWGVEKTTFATPAKQIYLVQSQHVKRSVYNTLPSTILRT